MKVLRMLLVCFFLGIIISLAFATSDFSDIQYGNIINYVGILGTIGIPLGFIFWIIRKFKK